MLATAIRQEKEIKSIQIGKEEAKLSLSADDMIVYIENPIDSTKTLFDIISEFGKTVAYKVNIQPQEKGSYLQGNSHKTFIEFLKRNILDQKGMAEIFKVMKSYFTQQGYNFLKRFLKFIFIERGRKGENHQCVVASHVLPTGDLAHNPDMCPDWESN